MADVTGPISTLPGTTLKAPAGMKCDVHPDREAVKRVQGETDSFGSEMHDFCQECCDKYLADMESVVLTCERCGSTDNVAPWRDPDEGRAGPVYEICGGCRRRSDAYYYDTLHMDDD